MQKNAQAFYDKFDQFRNAVYVAIGQVHESQSKTRLEEEKKSPNPLPPPPPPPALSINRSPTANLLTEIHRGVNLKSVDREKARAEQSNIIEKSVGTLGDLQSILANALQERAKAILGDDDFDDDEDW